MSGDMTVVRAALTGAATTAAATALAARLPGRWRRPWDRENFLGQPLTLLEGPAVVAGLAGGALAAGHPIGAWTAVGAGALGALDDLIGSAEHKGLRGHLRALAHGQPTTGAAKVLGLAALGLAVAATAREGRDPLSTPRSVLAVGIGGALIAGSANLVNLLDVRPGRALKAGMIAATPLAAAGSGPAGAAVGVALVALPADVAGRSMLGDTGANALGALVGYAAIRCLPLPTQGALLAAVSVVTLASERVSFSAVIDRTGWLRRIDRWGRRD
jgi:UDP-GlcNAc:undecaprenyl-phosphate GlcNAc-1-phosphate transferase